MKLLSAGLLVIYWISASIYYLYCETLRAPSHLNVLMQYITMHANMLSMVLPSSILCFFFFYNIFIFFWRLQASHIMPQVLLCFIWWWVFLHDAESRAAPLHCECRSLCWAPFRGRHMMSFTKSVLSLLDWMAMGIRTLCGKKRAWRRTALG